VAWTYSGNPASSPKDEVRFLSGDTVATDPLVSDEEIAWAISKFTSTQIAAAACCNAIAAKFTRQCDTTNASLSISASQRAAAFLDLAKRLDPNGLADLSSLSPYPYFGGLSHAEKDTLSQDVDAVQPNFKIGQDDFPGTGEV
jgi:hypothetical protein